MNDDIVTRLRKKYSGQLLICFEAADEIQRLRKECDAWKEVALREHAGDCRCYETHGPHFKGLWPQ